MKAFQSRLMLSRRTLGNVVAACLSLTSATAWGLGLGGDRVSGNLMLPWAPQVGNLFSGGTNGSPISGLPNPAIVGPGIEFAYSPYQPELTFHWSVTVDLSDNQIRINEEYADSSPGSGGLIEISPFALTLSDLDWSGAPGIANATVVSQGPHITLLRFDMHSVQFNIDEVVVYPSGPFSYSRTTVVQLWPIPEPSTIALLALGAVAALWRKNRRADE